MMRRDIREDVFGTLECRQTTPDGDVAFRAERAFLACFAFVTVTVTITTVVVVVERRLDDGRGRV